MQRWDRKTIPYSFLFSRSRCFLSVEFAAPASDAAGSRCPSSILRRVLGRVATQDETVEFWWRRRRKTQFLAFLLRHGRKTLGEKCSGQRSCVIQRRWRWRLARRSVGRLAGWRLSLRFPAALLLPSGCSDSKFLVRIFPDTRGLPPSPSLPQPQPVGRRYSMLDTQRNRLR